MSSSDFARVNEPRLEKILHTIGLIEKSAQSYRVAEEGAAMLQEIVERIRPSKSPEPQTIFSPTGSPIPEGQPVTPPVAKEMADLSNLSTQQLLDRLLAAAEIIAKRRK